MSPPFPSSVPIGRPRSVRFVTFGCKVNQYDTQVLREHALRAGIPEADRDAEVVVVNTCTVTKHGAAQARKAVRRLARENPGARIYVTGCYAVSDPEEAAALPGVAGVIGNGGKADLRRALGTDANGGPFIESTVTGHAGHTRAFVKVEDGCPLRCSYCIVPSVRPAVSSKSPDTAVEEIRTLVHRGYREVVLTGVHLGAWGRREDPGRDLPLVDLIGRILAETRLERLRLSSIEALEVTDALLDLMAESDRVAPHLHLPLQSGSGAVLRAMRRRYTPEQFLDVVARVRDRLPDAALGTDLIVGFPGETEGDFEASRHVLRRAAFMRTHVFPFSPRPGTPAAEMPGPVDSREIKRRAREAERTATGLANEFADGRRGGAAAALVEDRRVRGRLTGMTGHYLRVFLTGNDELMGTMVPVRYGERVTGGVRAEVLS